MKKPRLSFIKELSRQSTTAFPSNTELPKKHEYNHLNRYTQRKPHNNHLQSSPKANGVKINTYNVSIIGTGLMDIWKEYYLQLLFKLLRYFLSFYYTKSVSIYITMCGYYSGVYFYLISLCITYISLYYLYMNLKLKILSVTTLYTNVRPN